MLSKGIKERETKVIDAIRSIGIGSFICANSSIGTLYDEFFDNLTKKLQEYKYIKKYTSLKADSIFNVIPEKYVYNPQYYINLTLHNTRTADNETYSSMNNGNNKYPIPEQMLSITLDCIEELIVNRKKQIEINSKYPEISQLLPTFLEKAKEYIKKFDNHVVYLKNGRLNYENCDNYDCLAVYYKNPQYNYHEQYVGIITFSRSKYGDYGMCISTPLGGSRSISINSFDEFDSWIKEAIRYLCN